MTMTEHIERIEVPSEVPTPAATQDSGGGMFTDEEFQKRVAIVMHAIEDPEKFRRCIAEIHTYLGLFDEGFRGMQQQMFTMGGPIKMFKAMMGRG